MKINYLSVDLLNSYQKIPMIKDSCIKYEFISKKDYQITQIPHVNYDMSDEEDIESWKHILNFNQSLIIVIEIDEKLVAGAIVATHSPNVNLLNKFIDTAILWDIRVDPQFQKSGLGKMLMNEVTQFAKKQGCNQLLIETQDNNSKAIDFYLKCGAYLYESRNNVYQDTPDEKQLLMIIDI